MKKFPWKELLFLIAILIALTLAGCRGKNPTPRYVEPTWKKCSSISEATGQPCQNKAKPNGRCLSHNK